MGFGSMGHWLLVLVVVLIIFGAGKLPRVMGDFAKGIKAFKAGMKEEDEPTTVEATAQVPPPSQQGSSAQPASGTVHHG
jgi:sec-independent protein translocase protein TatA